MGFKTWTATVNHDVSCFNMKQDFYIVQLGFTNNKSRPA